MSASPSPTAAHKPVMLDALIVGAGFAGMYQLHCARDQLGLSTLALEAGTDVGGTWYWNRYPGARCDSESHAYQFYFAKDLVQQWEWTERYPGQAEVLRYLNRFADHFKLRSHIRFNTRVSSARYDEGDKRWHVGTEGGEQFVARYLITAVGCLSTANVPQIEGLDDFKGRWYHTGQWPHEGVDFSGQRVGQFGTGSTGIQAAPVIAAQAAHLTVFQRTASYSIPAGNAPLSEVFKRHVKEHADEIYATLRSTPSGHAFQADELSAFDVSDAQREAIYEAAWQRGGLQFRATFSDLMQSREANETAASFVRNKIREVVRDPTVAEELADIDHPFAGRRPPIDTHYFETYNRDNVTLVNLRKTPIERITATGIKTSAAEYPLDIIVFATGFDALTGSLLKMNITGRGGRHLADVWRSGPRTYLGLQVCGFPNLFTITGPGSPSVLTNMPMAIEQHVQWITNCLAHLEAQGLEHIEPTEAASDSWQTKVEEASRQTLLSQVGHSWYLGGNIPGKPKVFLPYAGGLHVYREICEDVARDGYRGFVLSA